MIERTMRAVQLLGRGGYEQLSVSDRVPIPRPSVGEVLIRVSAHPGRGCIRRDRVDRCLLKSCHRVTRTALSAR